MVSTHSDSCSRNIGQSRSTALCLRPRRSLAPDHAPSGTATIVATRSERWFRQTLYGAITAMVLCALWVANS